MINRIGSIVTSTCVMLFLVINYEEIFQLANNIYMTRKWLLALLAIILFCALHLVRMMRYYLILSEEGIFLGQYIRIYLSTTLVNILIPYKLGELFRFYAVGKKCGNYRVSFLSIVTERFFDTCVIVMILAVHAFFTGTIWGWTLPLLGIFVLAAFLIYIAYPSTSSYLNRYIMLKTPLPRDIYVLRVISRLDGWYFYEKNIVKGKGILLLLFSIISWFIEYAFLTSLAQLIEIPFGMEAFAIYISGILADSSKEFPNNIFMLYCLICMAAFAGLYILASLYSWQKRRSGK